MYRAGQPSCHAREGRRLTPPIAIQLRRLLRFDVAFQLDFLSNTFLPYQPPLAEHLPLPV